MRESLKKNILQPRIIHFLPEYELRKLSKTTNALNMFEEKSYDLGKNLWKQRYAGFRTQRSANKQISLLNNT